MTENPKRICIVSAAYPPMRTSGAIQIDDLAREIRRRGHLPTVICPDSNLTVPYKHENLNGVEVLRLKTGKLHDIALAWRAVNETFMPYLMWLNFRFSPLWQTRFDGVVIYAPSIFFAPFARRIQRTRASKIYLIQRDIFPQWALDLGLLKRGLIFDYFARVAKTQYRLADVIGIQSPGNQKFFEEFDQVSGKRVEVLNNWLAPLKEDKCQINLEETVLKGRRICVYAGNLGRAQGVDRLVSLAEALKDRNDIGFVFVGRGSEFFRIKDTIETKQLENLLIFQEIPAEQIYGLLKQCNVGLVVLDRRHTSHNLPGKVLSYLQAGLPVFGAVNPANDLIDFVNGHGVGFATSDDNIEKLAVDLAGLIDKFCDHPDAHSHCRSVFQNIFSPEVVVSQLLQGLEIEFAGF